MINKQKGKSAIPTQAYTQYTMYLENRASKLVKQAIALYMRADKYRAITKKIKKGGKINELYSKIISTLQ